MRKLQTAILTIVSAALFITSGITVLAEENYDISAASDETTCSASHDYFEPFLQWVISTKNTAVSTTMKKDAESAIMILADADASLVDFGNPNDASYIESVYNSLEFIDKFNVYRKQDGFSQMGTNFQLLAMALLNADYDAKKYQTAPLAISSLFNNPEIVAAGYDDPWELWRNKSSDAYKYYSGTGYTLTGIGIRDGESIPINNNEYGNLISQNFAMGAPSYTTAQVRTVLDLYEKEKAIFTFAHSYKLDRWMWMDDLSAASAVFACRRDGESLIHSATIKKTSTQVTATVTFEGKIYTDTRQIQNSNVTGVKLSAHNIDIVAGKTYQLTATVSPSNASNKNLIWSSNNTIASVGQTGLVKMGTTYGKSVITVTTAAGSFKDTCTVRMLFTDVADSSKYYFEPVYWAADKGITKGSGAGTFKPQDNCTREAVVTFLWRLAGQPNPKSMTSPFSDVKDTSKYYYKAVLWAAENGIAGGYADGTFKPSATCLREHVVTFLWRYAGKPSPKSSKNPFNDIKSSDYYYKAALWANEKGIAKGYTTGANAGGFGPKLNCLREHVVTFLYRYAKL